MRGATVYSYPIGGGVTLGLGIYDRHAPARSRVMVSPWPSAPIRALTGGKANAVEIHFCRRPPADPGLYERILKTKALFDQYQSCVIVSRSDLKLSNPHADTTRYAGLSAQLDAMMRKDAISPATLLRHCMKPLLIQDEYDLDAIARRLKIHPRTMAVTGVQEMATGPFVEIPHGTAIGRRRDAASRLATS